MKKIFAFFLLLFIQVVYAWDSSSAYNTIAMSYTANTTITQIINLNTTQQSATTINFKVDVKNGGGRPTHDLNGVPQAYSGQTDSASITIYRYNSAGTLIGTTTSQTYILYNYGSNAGWSAAPGDNLHPFTQASVTYTGSLSDTAYIKIEMKGTDGAWWAGNYGAQWRTPTVTVGSGTTNIVYNSEFGVASNGVQAQGWTPSYGSWANCGVTSGNNTCVTQESGVTANMWGGGEDLNGGTTSGQSGGYSGTLTSDNATQAASGSITPSSSTSTPPPPNWQSIRTNSSPVVISNIYPTSNNSPANEGAANAFDGNTSTKYLNFDKKNAGVTVRLSQGRVVQKFTITTANDFSGRDPTSYKLYGSNDGVNWTLIKQDSLSLSETRFWTSPEIQTGNTTAYVYYFMLFPTTKAGEGCGLDCNSMQIAEITYYYDANDGVTSTDLAAGSTPANPGTAGSICSDCFSSNITSAQQALLDAARARRNAIGLGNRIDLYSDGSGNSVTIEQVGNYNRVQGLGGAGTNAHVAGFGTSVNIKQGDTLSGRNLIELYVQGNGNNVTISQARNTTTGAQDGVESGGHVARLSVTGDVGTYIIRQGNDGGANSGHFLNYTMSGSGGTHRVTQTNNGEKLAFISITGNSNNETVMQSGTGSHFLDLTMTGNNNSANITQSGSGSHKATINLANVGGASSLTLLQQGSVNQVYSISQQCANLSGCSVSVTQGTGP